MGKLKDIKWYRKGQSGLTFSFTSKVCVRTSGVFSITYPDFLDPFLEIPTAQSVHAWKEQFPPGSFKVLAKTLDAANSAMSKAINDYLSVTVTIIPVIRYAFTNTCAYCWDGSDRTELYPCGKGLKNYKWHRCVHDCDETNDTRVFDQDYGYLVGFRAAIVWQYTYRNAEGSERVEVKTMLECDDKPDYALGPWGEKLNSFTGIELGDEYRAGFKQLPYSEATAEVFYNAMMRLCTLGDILQRYLEDKDKLLELVGSGQKLLGQ